MAKDKYLITDTFQNISLAHEMEDTFKGDYDLKYEEVFFGEKEHLDRLKKLNSRFRYFSNIGFFNKGYAEFTVFVRNKYEDGPFVSDLEESEKILFSIEDVEIEFSKSSSIYNLFFLLTYYFNCSHFYRHIPHYNYYTVKMKNIEFLNIEDYLQQALFILNNTKMEGIVDIDYLYIPEEIVYLDEIDYEDEVGFKPLKKENLRYIKSKNTTVFFFL